MTCAKCEGTGLIGMRGLTPPSPHYTGPKYCDCAAGEARGRPSPAVTPDMRRVAKVIRQSRGLHLRNDSAIHKALDDLERGGYIAPDSRGSRYGWELLPAGVLISRG